MAPALPKLRAPEAGVTPRPGAFESHDEELDEELRVRELEDPVIPAGSLLYQEGESIKLEAGAVPVPDHFPSARYWLGTTANCPIQNVSIAGVTFHSFTGRMTHDSKLRPILPETRGMVVELTDDKIQEIIARAKKHFVRSRGSTAYLVQSNSRGYRAMPGDVPVARYLYIQRTASAKVLDWRRTEPAPMIEG